jgi:hypothetical protein
LKRKKAGCPKILYEPGLCGNANEKSFDCPIIPGTSKHYKSADPRLIQVSNSDFRLKFEIKRL